MRNLVPVDERELLWQFAFSENDSLSRHGDAWRERLGPRVSKMLQRGARRELEDSDWLLIRKVLMDVRGWYLETLLAAAPNWSIGRFSVPELGAVRLIRHEPFTAIAPSRRLGDFVAALDSGRDTPGDRFAMRYRRLRPKFVFAKVRGIPILVAGGIRGPFTEVDGLTRMSILYSRWKMGETIPEDIRVLLGLSDRLPVWSHF